MNMRWTIGLSVVLSFTAMVAASAGCNGSGGAGEGGSGGAGGSCPSYSGEVAAIINTYCVSCHVAGGEEADKPFDTYDGIATFAGEAQSEIEEGRMPPQDGTPMPSSAKETLLAWLSCGAPDN